MPKLTYPEATKKAKTEKARENYMVIQMDARLVTPYKDGVMLMQALVNAEVLLASWRAEPPLQPLNPDTVTSTTMSAQEYDRHKVAVLMGVSLSDVRAAEEAANAADPTT